MNVDVGKFVNPADVIFEVVNTDRMHLDLSAFEKDISFVHEGQRVTFTLPRQAGKTRIGKIHLVGNVINQDRTVPVHVHLPSRGLSLAAGGYVCKCPHRNHSHPVPTLPDALVMHSDGKT